MFALSCLAYAVFQVPLVALEGECGGFLPPLHCLREHLLTVDAQQAFFVSETVR